MLDSDPRTVSNVRPDSDDPNCENEITHGVRESRRA
jgi:hypothetical protein